MKMSLFSLLQNLQFLNSPLNFTSSWIKEIKFFLCVCMQQTMTKMMVAIIKLLRDKRKVVVRRIRRDIGMLLESRPDVTVRIQRIKIDAIKRDTWFASL